MANKAGMATGVEVARISVKVSPDTKKFRSELKTELEAIEKSIKGDIEVKAHLDPAQAIADFQRMMAKLKTQGAKGVKVNASVSQTGGGSGGGSGGGGGKGGGSSGDEEDLNRLQKLFQALKSKLLQAPSFGTGINPAGYLVLFTAIAAVAAPLAGLVTSLLLTLPGLLALILTPIAAITLGLDGMKKAAEVMKPAFDELRATMNAAVQDQFTPVFTKLNEIFPKLNEAMPAVSQGLSQMLAGVVGAATSPEGLASIEKTIYQIGAALQGAAPGAQSMTSAFIKLSESFTGGPLQGLVTWFNGAMASFDAWVTKAQESGQLDAIFRGLGEALKVVADTIGAIAKIGVDTMLDPEAWAAFMALLKGTGAILVWVFDVSKSFLNALGVFGKFVLNIFASIAPFLAGLAGNITMIASSFVAWLTSLPGKAAGAFAAVTGAISSFVASAVSFFASLPSRIGGVFQSVVSTVQGALSGLVSLAQTAFSNFAGAVQNGISIVVSFVAELPGKILSALGNLGSLLIDSGRALIQGFINGIKNMIGAAVDAAKSVVSAVRNLFPFSPAKEGPFSGKGWVYYSGKSIGEGLAQGITDSTKPAVEAAKELANEVKKAMDAGGDGSSILGDVKPDDLKTLIAAIEEEKKRLKIIKNSRLDKEGKASVQQQIDQLQAQKDILSYQKDRLKNQESLNTTGEEDPFVKAASGLMKTPLDFVQATGKQFLTDIGISGDGFISKAITEGISYVFNIGSVDEAMSIKDRQDSKQALAITGR